MTPATSASGPWRHVTSMCLFLLAAAIAAVETPVIRPVVRDHYIDVAAYPDYHRRPWPMPSWTTFGNTVQLVGDRYLNAAKIRPGGSPGTVFRPNYDILTGPSPKDFTHLLSLMKEADPKLFIWNLGGYIWTQHPGGFVKYDFIEQMKTTLGDCFLGCDIGEQDGHYINGYRGITRLSSDPFEEYLKLHLIQQRIAEDHADKSSLLTVMYNWHGPIRDGLVVSAAAECQNRGGITGTQVQYAFLRGAARQFGTTLAGDVSVFTSWDKYWTSTALRRRMLYSQYQWNCAILSCEDAYGPADIVKDFNRWMQGFLKVHPRPGPMHAPVALLTDPFQGWMAAQTHVSQFTRHGHQPYGPGDFLTHLLLDLVYPRYQDNGIWKDESRALVPTPFGDGVEVVTSDCPAPVLDGYGVVIAASDLPDGGPELRGRLETFVDHGGHLLITAANARHLWPAWGINDTPVDLPAGSTVTMSGTTITEPHAFQVWRVDPARIPGATVTAHGAGTPLVCAISRGKGLITLMASPHGLDRTPRAVVDRPYPLWKQKEIAAPDQVQPHVLAAHVREVVAAALRSQQLFTLANDQLAFIVNRRAADTYLVGIYNPHLTQQPYTISSRMGAIVRQEELPLDNLASRYPLLPAGFAGDNKPSDATHIAAGEVRLFLVTVTPGTDAIRLAPSPVFTGPPRNRFVRMPTLPDLERSLLRWPTFFQHCDGVMLDWTQVRDIDRDALQYDLCRWLNRQRVRFVIDCRPGQEDGSLGCDPDHAAATGKTLADLRRKLDLLDGARDLLFAARTTAEIDGLRTLASDPACAAYRFHVLPLSQAARPAPGTNPARLRLACTDTVPTATGDPDTAGLLLLTPGGGPVDHVRTAARPGIQVLDAVYADWAALFADLDAAWEHPRAGVLTGMPVTRREAAGTAAPAAGNLHLSLRDPGSAERALLTLDPAWRDCAGVKLESELVWMMDADACRRLGRRMQQRGLKVLVDFSDHLSGWSGLTFQDLSAIMKTPAIGNHARSQRVFANVAAKLPLLGVTDALFVISPATVIAAKNGVTAAQAAANRAAIGRFCDLLRDHGVTGHLWHRPFRDLDQAGTLRLVQDMTGLKAALNLNADPDLGRGLAWARDRLGMIVLGGGTFAVQARNAVISSSDYSGLMYAPLALRPTPLTGLPATVPWVLDGDYRTAQEVRADVQKVLGSR